jgi:hypothetical protein
VEETIIAAAGNLLETIEGSLAVEGASTADDPQLSRKRRRLSKEEGVATSAAIDAGRSTVRVLNFLSTFALASMLPGQTTDELTRQPRATCYILLDTCRIPRATCRLLLATLFSTHYALLIAHDAQHLTVRTSRRSIHDS